MEQLTATNHLRQKPNPLHPFLRPQIPPPEQHPQCAGATHFKIFKRGIFMKNYDNHQPYKMKTHTIRATLQSGPYKGHIAYKRSGNVYGAEILKYTGLDDMLPEDVEKFVENDCEFRITEEHPDYDDVAEYLYTYILKDEEGNTCKFETYEEDDVLNNVVALEIINVEDYKE